ncbi:MAG: zinc/manganese transport system substrate-binding protein [Pseudonocardiales bacterium]|nr:zinc/manganese transport system substrate-binding protein [Pseudonocardiales bacterium]
MVPVVAVVAAAGALVLAGCSTSPVASKAAVAGASGGGTVIPVAASINAWGSILAQLGGSHVKATSIITNPDTDPHDYEPTPADGRVIASSRLFVENGIGYDSWAARAVQASPDSARQVIDVGPLTGTPVGGNPHRWYSPSDVSKVADAITADLTKIDPADAGYFTAQRSAFENTALAQYHRLITDIKTTYAGTPVGASESIFAPLADALGLDLITPASFLKDISEGTDPSAADKATIDAQISSKKIKVYVYNSQNSTPDVSAQVAAAKRQGIPVASVTETLSPAGASFQDWQSAQLRSLEAALAKAAGK